MKIRRPDSIRSHKGVLIVMGAIFFLVMSIWAFQLTGFFQERLHEAPDAVISTQLQWDEAIAESEKVAQDLPLVHRDTEEVVNEFKQLLQEGSKAELQRQQTLNQIAEDLLIELERSNAEENAYAEEE